LNNVGSCFVWTAVPPELRNLSVGRYVVQASPERRQRCGPKNKPVVARSKTRVCASGGTHSSTSGSSAAASIPPRGIALLHEPAEIEMS
jgi:hypothetical protein